MSDRLREAAEAAEMRFSDRIDRLQKTSLPDTADMEDLFFIRDLLRAALSAPEPPVEGWPEWDASIGSGAWMEFTLHTRVSRAGAPYVRVGLSQAQYETARRAIAQAEAYRAKLQSARDFIKFAANSDGGIVAEIDEALGAETGGAVDPRIEAARGLAEAARVYRLTAGAENRGLPSDVCVEAEAAFDAALAKWEATSRASTKGETE